MRLCQQKSEDATLLVNAENGTNSIKEAKLVTTYAGLIALAILSAPDKRLLLSDIYKFVGVHRRLVKAASHDNWKV